MRHPGIPTGVHVLLERDGRVLLMRRAGTGFFDGLYSLPGGHVEEGESLAATAVREMREELGIELAEAGLVVLGVVHRRSDTNRIDFFLQAADWSGEPVIEEPDKCDELVWCSRDALPEAVVPYIRAALQAGSGPWIHESGWA
jgi:mutator protein MutT